MNYRNLLIWGIQTLVLFTCEGPEGKIGPAGLNSLVNMMDEPAGTNCTNGGIKISTGLDKDGNGQLADAEVTQTKYVCKGDTGTGGKNSLINISTESVGANCANGGIKIESGLDQNGDGQLTNNEVTQTKYVCKGDPGTNGKTSLINISTEPAGANCATGGTKVESGLDQNADSQLSTNEIIQTKYLCKGDPGTNGKSSLINIIVEPSGNNCTTGGYKFQVGLDLNDNLALDQAEIQATKYICAIQIDKLERLEVGPAFSGSNSINWFFTSSSTNLIKFNKLSFANVDSITFVPSLNLSLNNVTGVYHVYADLYNVTDNVSINHSQVETTSTDFSFVESRNIWSDLPDKEITLALRVKTENINVYVQTGLRSYLFIYKH